MRASWTGRGPPRAPERASPMKVLRQYPSSRGSQSEMAGT